MKAFTLVELIIALVIVGILFVIILGGCQLYYTSRINEGIVVWKKFVPEHVEETTQYIDMGNDGFKIPITSYHTIPDSYTIGLEGQYEGKTYVRTIPIDRQSYLLIEEGQFLKTDCLPLTEPISAEKE